MKTMHSNRRLISLLLTFGLCFVHFGLADISLKLQNNYGYLPPPSQHLDNNRYSSSQQQREQFQESNYGSSPYQIFEVHQHFETTPQALQATQTPYAANGYLPPHQELHVQQINNQLNSAQNSAEENEDNLNISFLSFAAGETSNGQQITLTEKVPQEGPTPAGSTVPIPFPSNFKHNFPQQQQQGAAYKAAEYLPPTQATTTHHHHHQQQHQQPTSTLRQPQSSTPQQRNNYQQTTLPYNAPEYLPPQPQPTASVYTTYGQQQQTTVATHSQPLQKPQYQAPTYLPPYRHSQGRQRVRQQHHNQVQQHGGKSQVAKTQYSKPSYQAPDYLPPRESSSPQPQQQPQTPPQTTQYRSSQYQQSYTTTTSQTSSYQAPTYLPPNQDTTLSSSPVVTTTPQRQQSTVTTTSTTAAVALPAGYDYQTPEERPQPTNTQQQGTYQSGGDYRAPQQSPSTVYNAPQQQSSSTVYNAPQQQQSSTVYNAPQQQSSSTVYNTPQQSSTTVGFLPSGYDYNNPEEKQRTTPTYSQQVTQEQQQQQGQHQQGHQHDHNEEPAQEIPGTTTTFSYRQPQQPQERQVEYHYTQHSLPPLPSPTPSIVQEIYHEQRVLPAGYDEQPEQRQEQAEDYQQRPLPTPSIETQAETHGYLPPGYDRPVSVPQQNFQQYSSTSGSTSSSAPLPQPTPSIVQELRISKTVSSGSANSYQAPTYLPPGYDAPNPLTAYEQQQVAQLLHSQPENQPQTQVGSQGEKRQPGDLPAGYDFEKPDNAEEAIAELHSLQRMLEAQKKAQEQQQQQFNGQQHNAQPQQQNIVVQAQLSAGPRVQSADIIYGTPKSTVLKPVPSQQTSYQQQPFRQNFRQQKLTVSPPAPQPQQQSSYKQQAPQLQQQSRQYQQQPQALSFQSQTNNGYLPPHPFTAAPTASLEPHMHTLSSFMTTVQPNERYGKAIFNTPRMPFPAYGPPPSTAAAFQQSHSSVYAQHNSIQHQQHYAPAMPYNHHHHSNGPIRAPAYTTFTYKPNTYTLRPEARESLQKFMPKDLQEHMAAVYAVQPTAAATHSPPPPIQQPATTTTLHAAQPATAKIRTVQIFNPSAIKTLKVLETLDDKGVKTIKILGPSNEDPMGSSRTIKVVSQSPHNANESRVQHVKIYNDHKEVPLGVENAQQQTHSNRAYLPPVVGSSTTRIARQAQKSKKKSFTGGRRRYRQ